MTREPTREEVEIPEPLEQVEAQIADRLENVLVADVNGDRFEISRKSAMNLYRAALEVLRVSGFEVASASRRPYNERPIEQRPSQAYVKHDSGCSLAKHLPRLRAMANRDVT